MRRCLLLLLVFLHSLLQGVKNKLRVIQHLSQSSMFVGVFFLQVDVHIRGVEEMTKCLHVI